MTNCACFLDFMEKTKRCGLRRQAQVQGKNKNASNRKQASKENETPPPKRPEEASPQKRIRYRVTPHAQQNLLRRDRSRYFCSQEVSKIQHHQNLARLFIVIGKTLCCVLKRWVLDWPTVKPSWRRPPPSEMAEPTSWRPEASWLTFDLVNRHWVFKRPFSQNFLFPFNAIFLLLINNLSTFLLKATPVSIKLKFNQRSLQFSYQLKLIYHWMK